LEWLKTYFALFRRKQLGCGNCRYCPSVFCEAIDKRLWCAIILITLSSILLTLDSVEGVLFSFGSLLVLGATICWGVENNCTRQIADKVPLQIVMVKGVGSGLGALVVALVIGEKLASVGWIVELCCLAFSLTD